MADEKKPKLRLEIGHILFMDVVGYSKLLMNEQTEVLAELNEIVRAAAEVRTADAEGKLIRLPTGDGMALVFRNNPEAAARCALEIAAALKEHPRLPLRMGIHSGPVNEIVDVNGRANIAGAGINMAQRVMDCGDAGHILLSRHVAENLEHYGHWQPLLSDLGESEVKHGVRVHIFNLCTDEVGNPTLPEKFRIAAPQEPATARSPASNPGEAKPLPWFPIAVVVLLIAALIVGSLVLSHRSSRQANAPAIQTPAASTLSAIPAKSIAVLPFENLSEEKANAYFADGVQEEILTKLARIADLKVISRTSTAKYKSRPEDLQTVSRQLSVASVLEGTVQRSEGKVRVNVQLFDARADAQLWADTYDRSLTDIFTVESDIANRVADALQAKLTSGERTSIEVRPTESTAAHDLYFKGRFRMAKSTHEDTLQAIEYYEQAIAEDPNYALAYAGLAEAYASETGYSRMPAAELLAQGRVAAEKALAINGDLPEAHVSLAAIALSQLNLKESRVEVERAIALNSNLSEAHYYLSALLASLGRFDASILEAKRALQLDPLSLNVQRRLGATYRYARRYPEAIDVFRQSIKLNPAFSQAQDGLGVCLELTGDLDGAEAQFQKSFQASGGDFHSVAFLAHCYGLKGEREKAIQTLGRLKELEQKAGAEWAYGYALVAIGLNDKEQAIDWLERSYLSKESFALLLIIRVDPLLDPLRGNPRFEALADKIIPPNSL